MSWNLAERFAVIEFWNNEIWPFLLEKENREAIGTIIAVLGVVGAVWLYLTGRLGALVAWVFRKKAEDGKEDHAPEKLTVESFLAIQAKLRAELQAELAGAHAEERDQLLSRIEQLNQRMANPEPALAEAQARIADLEDILRREGNEIGAERLSEAIGALEAGDFSYADGIFAEIEEREKLGVQRAARAAFGRGEVAEAQVRWLDAADHYDRAAKLDPSFDNLQKAGDFAWRAGRHDAAIVHEEAALDHAMRVFGPEDEKTATAMGNLAQSYQSMGRYTDAEPLLQRDLEIKRQTLGSNHSDTAVSLNNLGGLLKITGRFEEAEPLYRDALEITRSALGADHPTTAIRLNNLAGLLQATGRFEEAEPLYREALEIRRSALGADHPDTASSLNNLAGLLEATGRLEEAEPLYREALEITRRALGADHPDTAGSLNNLASLMEATGRFEEVEPLFREALEIRRRALGADHPDTGQSLNNLAVLLANTDRWSEALPMMRDALAIREAALGPDHPNTQTTRASLEAMEAHAPSP